MCGIWGAVSKTSSLSITETDKILPQLIIAGSLRGTDGTGLFSIHKDFSVKTTKKEGNSFWLLFDEEYAAHQKDIWRNGIAYFGHNRAATKGKISKENTHPFESKNLTLIHNGTVQWGLGTYEKKHEVDSACLVEMIEELGMLETSKKVNMAYALIWYDKRDKTLHFCRNNERPLYILETLSTYFFVSEPPMMEWILERNSEKVIKCHEVLPLKEHIIHMETDDVTINPLEQKPYTNYNNHYYPTTTYKDTTETSIKSLINQKVYFTLHHHIKSVQNKQQPFFTYYGRTATGYDIKFSTKKDLTDQLKDQQWEGTGNTVEKADNKWYLIIRAKSIKKLSNDNSVIVDQFLDEDEVLDLGDGTLLSAKDFKEKSKNNCGYCGRKLFLDKHHQYAEAPDTTHLLCETCTPEYICDSVSFKAKYDYKRHVH